MTRENGNLHSDSASAARATAVARGQGPRASRWLSRVGGTATLALALAATGCGNDDRVTTAAAVPRLIATMPVWAAVASEATCLDVPSLMPPEADPHSFEPSLADRERLDGAVVIANGLGLESGLVDLLDDLAGPVVTIADAAGLEDDNHSDAGVGDHSGEELPHDEHEHRGENPHLWYDPVVVRDAVAAVADAAVDAGADASRVAACATAFTAKLDELDSEVRERVATLPRDRRVVLTDHDTLDRFADRYGLDVVGVIADSTSSQAETSAGHFAKIEDVVAESGATRILVQPNEQVDDVNALAERLGLDVVELPPFSGGDYGDDLRRAVDAIAGG